MLDGNNAYDFNKGQNDINFGLKNCKDNLPFAKDITLQVTKMVQRLYEIGGINPSILHNGKWMLIDNIFIVFIRSLILITNKIMKIISILLWTQ